MSIPKAFTYASLPGKVLDTRQHKCYIFTTFGVKQTYQSMFFPFFFEQKLCKSELQGKDKNDINSLPLNKSQPHLLILHLFTVQFQRELCCWVTRYQSNSPFIIHWKRKGETGFHRKNLPFMCRSFNIVGILREHLEAVI